MTQNDIDRINTIAKKYSLRPYSKDYQQHVKNYCSLNRLPSPLHPFTENIFLYPYNIFTLLDDCLYYVPNFYAAPPMLVSKPDSLFRIFNLPIPEQSLKELLFQEFKLCLNNWLKPFNHVERKVILSTESDPSLDNELKDILSTKESLSKIHKVLIALKDYFLQNGLPSTILEQFNAQPLEPFKKYFYQLDKNIIMYLESPVIKSIPSPSGIAVLTVANWLQYFNKEAPGYDSNTICAAYPVLCKSLKCYPKNENHSYIILNKHDDFIELVFKDGVPELLKYQTNSDRFRYFAMQSLNFNQQNLETVKNILTFLLQQKFSNLNFFSRLMDVYYTEIQVPSLYIIRLSDDSDYNERFLHQLELLIALQDISSIIQTGEFSPDNLNDWYSHLYCAIIHMNNKISRKEGYLLKWIKGELVKSKLSTQTTIFYRNTMPLIMLINTKEEISYLRIFLEHRHVKLYDLELNPASSEPFTVQQPISDSIRLLMLLGKYYKPKKTTKRNKAVKAFSPKEHLKIFVESFCSVGGEDATPISSKIFYDTYIQPYFAQFTPKPIGPTNFNKLLMELFPGQIDCRKYHPKPKVEGIHIFGMEFHEEKWNDFQNAKQDYIDAKQNTFSEELQNFMNYSIEMIDTIRNRILTADHKEPHL